MEFRGRVNTLVVALSVLSIAAGGNTLAAAAVPTASLTLSASAVAPGGSATLTWSSTNATFCTASNAWSGKLATSGTQSTGPLTKNSTFVMTCTGPGGTSPVVKQGINVVPTVTLTANPASVASGAASALTWTSINATSCTASGGWSGALAATGTQSTGALTQNQSYAISCTGPAGTSKPATATVTISSGTAAISISPRSAALTLGRTQQFVAKVLAGGGTTWTVDGIANGNSTVGTISVSGLYTAGTAVGAHIVAATSIANTTQSASVVAAVTDLAGVYTYHNNLARDGTDVQEYALTPSNVNTNTFGKLASCTVDGAIYGQPLWVPKLTVGGAVHNVVFVATQHDSVYAFDADASPCVMLWSASLIDVAHGGLSGESAVPYSLLGYAEGAIQPEVGVTGTPVIDPTTGILYVVSLSTNSAQTTYYQRLHAIDLATGTEKSGSPATIAGSSPRTGTTPVAFNARQELQRTALALVNHIVFIAWGSQEDLLPFYGWIMGYQYNGTTLTQTAVLNVAPNAQGGGIWMSGGAPAVDAGNNLYFLTGNGGFDATNSTAPNNDYGDSLLQLSTALHVSQYFTPTDQLTDDQNDKDFGSGGAAILADLPQGNAITHVLICGGKDGTLYVINRDLLGGFGDTAAVQQPPINLGHSIFSTGAFWNSHFYLAGINGPLTSYQLNTSTAHLSLASSSTHVFGFPGVTPSISSAANQNGIVWALDTGNYCTNQSKSCGPAVLHAYDAANLGTELWNSSLNATDAAGYAVKFTVPTVANGKVYVGTRGNNIGGVSGSTSVAGELDIYGLKP